MHIVHMMMLLTSVYSADERLTDQRCRRTSVYIYSALRCVKTDVTVLCVDVYIIILYL